MKKREILSAHGLQCTNCEILQRNVRSFKGTMLSLHSRTKNNQKWRSNWSPWCKYELKAERKHGFITFHVPFSTQLASGLLHLHHLYQPMSSRNQVSGRQKNIAATTTPNGPGDLKEMSGGGQPLGLENEAASAMGFQPWANDARNVSTYVAWAWGGEFRASGPAIKSLAMKRLTK